MSTTGKVIVGLCLITIGSAVIAAADDLRESTIFLALSTYAMAVCAIFAQFAIAALERRS